LVCLLAQERLTVDGDAGEAGERSSASRAQEEQAVDVLGSIACASSQAEHRALLRRFKERRLRGSSGMSSLGIAGLTADFVSKRCSTSGRMKSLLLQPSHLRPSPGFVRSHKWHVIHDNAPWVESERGRTAADVSLVVNTLSLVVTGTIGESGLRKRNLSLTCTFQISPRVGSLIPRPAGRCPSPVDELGWEET
jgi:hypothetical protein